MKNFPIKININFYFSRNIAIDEGGIPYKGNSPHRSYIPSKPNPNCLEYYVSVDENYFPTCLRWETPTR